MNPVSDLFSAKSFGRNWNLPHRNLPKT